jgi:hypothetical protein
MKNSDTIPKIINYCWFGHGALPELANKCINSWKKYCPDYEIRRWDESNFDINCCDYVKEAYAAKKWAFVSDYARFKILYENGGLYFDTDVEIVQPLDKIVERGSFMGAEQGTIDVKTQAHINAIIQSVNRNRALDKEPFNDRSSREHFASPKAQDCSCGMAVAPGLGMGAVPGLKLYKEIIEFYERAHFVMPDGSFNQVTVVMYTTEYLKKCGLVQPVDSIEKVADIFIYPPEYFCPMNKETGQLIITPNTYSIHHYMESWHSTREISWNKFKRRMENKIGYKAGNCLFRSIPMRLIGRIYMFGLVNTLERIVEKIKRK